MGRLQIGLCLVALLLSETSDAAANGAWLIPDAMSNTTRLHICFSDNVQAALLDKMETMRVWRLMEQRKVEFVDVTRNESSICLDAITDDAGTTYGLTHDFGISSDAGGEKRVFLHAKAHTSADPSTWKSVRDAKRLPLEIVSLREGLKHAFVVLSDGRPLAEAVVCVNGPDAITLSAKTDDQGRVVFEFPQSGLYGVWTELVDPRSGELGGKGYMETRHRSTLTLPIEVIPIKKITVAK